MSVDTAGKRFSLMSMGRPWVRTLPLPDGAISTVDRFELVLRYAGMLTSMAVVVGNARATGAARAHPRAALVTDE